MNRGGELLRGCLQARAREDHCLALTLVYRPWISLHHPRGEAMRTVKIHIDTVLSHPVIS